LTGAPTNKTRREIGPYYKMEALEGVATGQNDVGRS